MSTTRLPELPAPDGFAMGYGADVFSRPRMHAYGLAVWKAAMEAAAAQVPDTWLDPMLTGKGGLGQPPYSCFDIQKLLANVRAAIRSLPLPELAGRRE